MRLTSQPFARPVSLQPPPRPLAPGSADPTQKGSFATLLVDQVKGVNQSQQSAEAMMQSLLTGGQVNEAEVLTSIQKADLAFRMLLQIRNKLVEAYREVQQIQV